MPRKHKWTLRGMHCSSTVLNVCTLLFAITIAVNVFLRFQVPTKTHSKPSRWPTLCTLQNLMFSLDTDKQLSTLITGVKYPIFAACACAAWAISRISYTRGYITGDPKKARTLFTFFSSEKLMISVPISAGWSCVYVGFPQHDR